MDGSDVRILLDNKKVKASRNLKNAPPIEWPNDIIIDHMVSTKPYDGEWSPNPMIYFCDAKYDYIVRTDFEFKEFHKIVDLQGG